MVVSWVVAGVGLGAAFGEEGGGAIVEVLATGGGDGDLSLVHKTKA